VWDATIVRKGNQNTGKKSVQKVHEKIEGSLKIAGEGSLTTLLGWRDAQRGIAAEGRSIKGIKEQEFLLSVPKKC